MLVHLPCSRSVVVLLCQHAMGGSHHRAVLFKVLADAASMICGLLQWKQWHGARSRSVITVWLGGQRLFLDLNQNPGMLRTQDTWDQMCHLPPTGKF